MKNVGELPAIKTPKPKFEVPVERTWTEEEIRTALDKMIDDVECAMGEDCPTDEAYHKALNDVKDLLFGD